ncbi:DsbA family protein [Dactylosporangium sp. AC04546]|uniref:DsbA family oxidoreductase n=1 Tax=Dactylosporangium sp. AC04546 TaxID=2862460 RepID=UPI001EE11111|nr:DsbA family protein [Dactylosporangium sp. AC04546]WVK85985.1 DsbA family protein [Dactylosporangium sp. AC04546]
MTLTVVEYTDPMCPWAWGSEPTFRRLRAALPGARWRRVFGILFDDGDDPAPDPAAETAWYHRHLQQIARHTRAPWPAVLERVALTSWPSSLVARAAQAQGEAVAERALRRLRETVFLLGRPADTPERALRAVAGIPGLDEARLAADAASGRVRASIEQDRRACRAPAPEVLHIDEPGPHNGRAKPVDDDGHRYALPTLVFQGPEGQAVVPGWRSWAEYTRAAGRVAPGSVREPAPPAPEDALRRYASVTEVEVGAVQALPGAVSFDTPGGRVWLAEDEARTHPALR